MALRRIPDNPIVRADGYKYTHWLFNNPKLRAVFSYLEARYGKYAVNIPFGFQYKLLEYFTTRITAEMVEYKAAFDREYFGTDKFFNRRGFEYIVEKHDGRWPVEIRIVPEGTPVPQGNIVASIRSTDERAAWAAQYIETQFMQPWASTQIATVDHYNAKLWLEHLRKTGTPEMMPWKLHDFGYRGVSCEEEAAIASAAHLVHFLGTDTTAGVELIKYYYGGKRFGGSVPAAEHANALSWGKDNEVAFLENAIDVFGPDESIPAFSVIADTWDVYHFARKYMGETLKPKIVNNKALLVMRPDSGDPPVVCRRLAEDLERSFGARVNDKGYKVLNHVGIIYGDKINLEMTRSILNALGERRYSADILVTGSGSGLLREHRRDDSGWALKPSAMQFEGSDEWVAVQKTPVDDNRKRSKAGVLALRLVDGLPSTVQEDVPPHDDLLQTVYVDGDVVAEDDFETIRGRALAGVLDAD
jgi:nicotinamide phosphoribosyltransferase